MNRQLGYLVLTLESDGWSANVDNDIYHSVDQAQAALDSSRSGGWPCILGTIFVDPDEVLRCVGVAPQIEDLRPMESRGGVGPSNPESP